MTTTLETTAPPAARAGKFDPADLFKVENANALHVASAALARLASTNEGPIRRDEIEAILGADPRHMTRHAAVEAARWQLRQLVRDRALKPLTEGCPEQSPLTAEEIIKDAMARRDPGEEAEALLDVLLGRDPQAAEEVKYGRHRDDAVAEAVRAAAEKIEGFNVALLRRLPATGRFGADLIALGERFLGQLPAGDTTFNEGLRLYEVGLAREDAPLRSLAVEVVARSGMKTQAAIRFFCKAQCEDLAVRNAAYDHLSAIIATAIPQPRS